MTVTEEFIAIATPAGDMRTLVSTPAASGRYPGIALFRDIFQITDPIRRTAASLAGHGYAAVTPEIYHERDRPGG